MKKILRNKLAMLLANLKKKRTYYCEVEYLASDGNQWIDTEFVMEAGKVMSFNGNMMWTQSQGNANFFYGYRSVNTAEYRGDMRAFFVYGASPAGRVAIRYGVNTDNSTNVAVSLNTKFNMSFDGDNLKVNGTTYATLTQEYTPANYQSMWLFNCNCTGYYSADVNHFIGRIYNWQIWSGGVLVRDLIPVLDWDMKPCMYDKVSGQLFYNKGTGNFTYGREIHYVDYLESTGTQYIDTGVKLTNNHSVELDYELTNASQSRAGLFGSLNMTGSNQGRFGSLLSPSNRYLEHGYGSGNDYWQQGLPDTKRHKLYQKKNELYFDETLIHTFNTATFNLDINAYLGNFVYTNYTPALAKYYGSKWWDGDTLIREYLPAIDENGVAFMFDRVSHTIYDNAGTGAFKYPIKEIEYIASTGTQYINTGVKGKNNLAYKTKVNFTSLSTSGSNGIGGEYLQNASAYIGMVRANGHFTYLYYNTAIETTKTLYANTDYVIDSVQNSGSQIVKIDDEVISNGTITATFTSTRNVFLFAICSTNDAADVYGSLKMSYCQILDNGTMIRDYIPAFYNGEAGMWDKANNVFYPNSGTGTFTTGKIVESLYE